METCFFALKLLLWGLANLHFEGVLVKNWSLHWTSFAWSLLGEPRKPSPETSNCKPFALRQTVKVGWGRNVIFFGKTRPLRYLWTVGTGGSPKNWSVWWCKCNKTLLFTVFSAHTQIAFMLMLREHMPCLFATRGRFLMTFLDTFSSQHIETA